MKNRNVVIADARALNEITEELQRARTNHADFTSAHEGLAVIREEYCELEREVFLKREHRSAEKMHKEAIQIAAMAIRFIVDLETDLPFGESEIMKWNMKEKPK